MSDGHFISEEYVRARWLIALTVLSLIFAGQVVTVLVIIREELGGSANLAAWVGGIGSMLAAMVGVGAAGVAWKIARDQDIARQRDAEVERVAKSWLLASWLSAGILEIQSQANRALRDLNIMDDPVRLFAAEAERNFLHRPLHISEEIHRGITEAHIFGGPLPGIIGAIFGSVLLYNQRLASLLQRRLEGRDIQQQVRTMIHTTRAIIDMSQHAIDRMAALRSDMMSRSTAPDTH